MPLGSLPFASPETVSAELHVERVSYIFGPDPAMPSGVKKDREYKEQRTEIQFRFRKTRNGRGSGEARACFCTVKKKDRKSINFAPVGLRGAGISTTQKS